MKPHFSGNVQGLIRKKKEKQAATAADAAGRDPKTLGGGFIEGVAKKLDWTKGRVSLFMDNILYYSHPARHDEFDPLPAIVEEPDPPSTEEHLVPAPSSAMKTAASGKVRASDVGDNALKTR